MKNLKYTPLIVAACFGLSSSISFAQATSKTDIAILPFAGPNMNDVVVDSQMTVTRSNNDTSTLDLYVYCFGTNLRSVANPVSPNSVIYASIEYQNKDGSYKTLDINFEAKAAFVTENLNKDISGNTAVRDGNGAVTSEKFNAYLRGNLVRVAVKNTKTIGVNVLSTGVDFAKLDAINKKSLLFKSIRFNQKINGPQQGQYMGTDGPLTAAITWYFAENGKKATVYAGFPGENQFCGGYFSPIVLSFHEDVPDVDQSSTFALFAKDPKALGNKQKISWPSFKKEIYLLAIDHNKSGKIEYGGELFGDINGYENGFENLRAYDDNKDGVIDSKDKIFSQLVLWKDSNHDGVSGKKEVIPLSQKGVTSISLTFKNDLRSGGNSAKILGPGEFTYKVKNGTEKKGLVWDIFLTAIP